MSPTSQLSSLAWCAACLAAETAFEAVLRAGQSTLQGETLWYRMVAGGTAPRYVRLRPRPSLSAVVSDRSEQALADDVNHLIAKIR